MFKLYHLRLKFTLYAPIFLCQLQSFNIIYVLHKLRNNSCCMLQLLIFEFSEIFLIYQKINTNSFREYPVVSERFWCDDFAVSKMNFDVNLTGSLSAKKEDLAKFLMVDNQRILCHPKRWTKHSPHNTSPKI